MMAVWQLLLIQTLGVALLLVHITLQSILVTSERGVGWNAGPRDESPPLNGVYGGRAERALKNYLETFPALVALALPIFILNKVDQLAVLGAWMWLSGRIAYIPLYLFGISYVRSAAWIFATTGLFLMFVSLCRELYTNV